MVRRSCTPSRGTYWFKVFAFFVRYPRYFVCPCASFRNCRPYYHKEYKNTCGTQIHVFCPFREESVVHSSTIHVPDELIVLVFACELFDINRVFIVVFLPSGRTLRTETSLDFLSLFIFFFCYLFAFLSSIP